jgi:acyl-coenzyme A thioesterase PaaI-like protein
MTDSLQDRYAPDTRCFGCGPNNPDGLRIKSSIVGDEGMCEFWPETHHESFQGNVAGGIICTLFDCHCNWIAAHHLMMSKGLGFFTDTATTEITVKFASPTPSAGPLRLRAKVVQESTTRATVVGRLEVDGTVTATCRAEYAAVDEGHPAYSRWRPSG